ncbi:MAG: hypothetical protein ACJATW_001500 [Glaciecola sp.]
MTGGLAGLLFLYIVWVHSHAIRHQFRSYSIGLEPLGGPMTAMKTTSVKPSRHRQGSKSWYNRPSGLDSSRQHNNNEPSSMPIMPIHFFPKAFATLALAAAVTAVSAVEPVFIDHGMYNAATGEYFDKQSEFVGGTPAFGRFPDGVVKMSYNHAGAPADTSIEEMEAILRKSIATIEGIADIKFDYSGVSADPVADAANNVVVVAWFTREGSTLATAGPTSSSDTDAFIKLGYFPYISGSLDFNTNFGDPTVSTTVHEMMHLLGLAHSDSPVSIMRPEDSRFNEPQADDIAALQAMYGPPDILTIPNLVINLSPTPASGGVVVDTAASQFLLGAEVEPGGFTEAPVQTITAGAVTGSTVTLQVDHSGTVSDTALTVYLTDPNGHTNLLLNNTLNLAEGRTFIYVESYEILAAIAGDWIVTVGNGGSQIAKFTLPVDVITSPDNKNPVAALTKTSIGNNQFNLAITASDPEGDLLKFTWNIPGEGEISDAAATLNVTAQSPNPVIAFAQVQDAGIKRSKEGPETTGFGALFSRYIVLPAQENTPTFYVQEKILHLPTLNAGGLVISANFKLTALPGVVFKLLEFDVLSGFTGTAGSSVDLATGTLNMPTIIVSDNGTTVAIPDVNLKLDPTSQPIKFGI